MKEVYEKGNWAGEGGDSFAESEIVDVIVQESELDPDLDFDPDIDADLPKRLPEAGEGSGRKDSDDGSGSRESILPNIQVPFCSP